jgi:hypothetical protein
MSRNTRSDHKEAQLRRTAVKRYRAGIPAAEVARQLHRSRSWVYKWVQYRNQHPCCVCPWASTSYSFLWARRMTTRLSKPSITCGHNLGYWLRHALHKLPDTLVSLATPVRKGLRSKFHSLLHRCRQRKSLRSENFFMNLLTIPVSDRIVEITQRHKAAVASTVCRSVMSTC